MRGNPVTVIFAALVIAASCSSAPDSSEGAPANISVDDGAVQEDTADNDSVEDDIGDAPDVADVGGPGLASMLDDIPAAAFEAAMSNESRSVEVELVDYNAASDLAGLDRPDGADVDAGLDWFVSLTLTGGEAGFAITPASFPDPQATAFADEVIAELGFSAFDIDRVAVLQALPVSYAVAYGVEDKLSADLVDVGGGIVSAGEGEDLTIAPETRTPARPLGRPLRLASRDGAVAASFLTPLIESWLADEPSLASIGSFATVAEALDSAGAVSAYIVQSDFGGLALLPDAAAAADFAGFASPYQTVGIGSTLVDGRGTSIIAYAFPDDAAAAAAAPQLETLWQSAPLVGSEGTMADFFESPTVEQAGAVVVITAQVGEGVPLTMAQRLLFSGELVFTSY